MIETTCTYLMAKEMASWVTFEEARSIFIINTQDHGNFQNKYRE